MDHVVSRDVPIKPQQHLQAVTAATKSHDSGQTVGTPTLARYSVLHIRRESASVFTVDIGTPSLSHFGR